MQWNPDSAEASGTYPIVFRKAKFSAMAFGLPSCWMWKLKAKDIFKGISLPGSLGLAPSERAKAVRLLKKEQIKWSLEVQADI